MGERLDIATFGEAMAVFHPVARGPLSAIRTFDKGVGGAELNVAIGTARLGHRAAWAGRVGADPFGAEVLATLRANDVDVTAAQTDPTAPTGLYVKEIGALGDVRAHYFRTDTAARRTRPDDLNLDTLGRARVLHLTGITPALSPSCHASAWAALHAARAKGTTVSFDANVRATLIGDRDPRALLHPFIERCDLLFLSADEARLLLDSADPHGLQTSMRELPAHDIVVHDTPARISSPARASTASPPARSP